MKNPDGIESIRIRHPVANALEIDHIQYGTHATVTATWDDGQVIQGSGGGLDPALIVGLEPLGGSAPSVATPNSETVVLTYAGLDPNETLQINVGSYGLPFYPPDPFKLVGNQIQVEFDDAGTMATLLIDVTSSSGGLLDPASAVAFNPQPEPPASGSFNFDPPPPAGTEMLSYQIPLTGGIGPAGSTTITLSLQILDDGLSPLPVSTVEMFSVPLMGPLGLGVLALGLGLLATRRLRQR